jgi:hypothetical protein
MSAGISNGVYDFAMELPEFAMVRPGLLHWSSGICNGVVRFCNSMSDFATACPEIMHWRCPRFLQLRARILQQHVRIIAMEYPILHQRVPPLL